MDGTRIKSVGIDIGTTTTQLVFSELTLGDTAGAFQMPRYAITDRRITYASPVAFTPKLRGAGGAEGAGADTAGELLDAPALRALIRGWYAAAGVEPNAAPPKGGPPQGVTSGAVIVTGESLKTPNARRTVLSVADELGDFVVATAGPKLESVIAGRGSGAAGLSRKLHGTVLNIDIGGGTSNYAAFRNGEVLDAACLNVGGRLLILSPEGTLLRLYPPAVPIVNALFGNSPQHLSKNALVRVAERMAGLIYEVAVGRPSPLAAALLQTAPLAGRSYDAVVLSGGVGACLREETQDPFRYGDLGPLLAAALRRNPGMRSLPLAPPAADVRATVIGAGAWSLSLSGSTVWAEPDVLPLKNVPVVTIPLPAGALPDAPRLAELLRRRVGLHDLDAAAGPFVLAFGPLPATYGNVSALAEGIGRYWLAEDRGGRPLLAAVAGDMGKALGLELRGRIPAGSVVVIDEVRLAEGDYLDLGRPLGAGRIVPLVIKSLAFP